MSTAAGRKRARADASWAEFQAEEKARRELFEASERRQEERATKLRADKDRDEKAIKSAAAADLERKIATEKRIKGLDFTPPDVPGAGWATEAVKDRARLLARLAEARFGELIEARERLRVAKLDLAGVPTSVLNPTAGSNLQLMRDAADVADARAEVATADLDELRRRVGELNFLADLEIANERSDGFEPWVTFDGERQGGTVLAAQPAEEAEQLRDAMRAYMRVIVSLIERQRVKAERCAAACEAARNLGISPPRESDGGVVVFARTLPLHVGEAWAQQIAKDALLEALKEHPDLNWSARQLAVWFPDFGDPTSWLPSVR